MHINDIILEPIKKICYKLFKSNKPNWWWHGDNRYKTPGHYATDVFRDLITSPDPVMIARFGSTELSCVLAYIISNSNESYLQKSLKFFNGDIPAFWFGTKNINEICANSGFFPKKKEMVIQFCERLIDDIKISDVHLSWLNGEKYTFPYLPSYNKIVWLWDVVPFFRPDPWTMFLEGKKVLVIHPYDKTIAQQYEKRHLIFPDQQILPDMDLKTFKAVQTIENNKSEFDTWFDALNYMKTEIAKIDFDVALIGAGAYGMPLAADIKRMGKKAIHIGGSLQLYFGIKGLRWDNDPGYQSIYNEHWVRPLPEEHPKDYKKMEGGAYW